MSKSSTLNGFISYSSQDKKKGKKLETKIIQPFLKILLHIFGAERYSMIIRLAALVGRKEYHYFLIEKSKK